MKDDMKPEIIGAIVLTIFVAAMIFGWWLMNRSARDPAAQKWRTDYRKAMETGLMIVFQGQGKATSADIDAALEQSIACPQCKTEVVLQDCLEKKKKTIAFVCSACGDVLVELKR
jgi:hypothetical protein